MCRLTERELMDIGITRGKIDYMASKGELQCDRATDGTMAALIYLMLCSACLLVFVSEARAQCTARDVLQNQLRRTKIPRRLCRRFWSDRPSMFRCGRRLQLGTFQIRLLSVTC